MKFKSLLKNIKTNKKSIYIRNNRIVQLFFNIIIMTCLILGLVYILFLFLPSEANLYFSNEVSNIDFTANSVYGELETNQITLRLNSKCKIELHNLVVKYNNKIYKNVNTLAIDYGKHSSGLLEIKRNDNTNTSVFFFERVI